jgi:hypothetical protein
VEAALPVCVGLFNSELDAQVAKMKADKQVNESMVWEAPGVLKQVSWPFLQLRVICSHVQCVLMASKDVEWT